MDRSPAETPLSLRADLLDPLVSLHWEKRNDLPAPVPPNAHSVWLNGKLYVGGGVIYDGGSHARLLVYSPSEDSWEVIPTPTERYALATYHSQLVLVGGWDPTTRKQASKVWLLEDRSWVPHPTVPDMPVSTSESAAVGFGDYLIVAGSEQDEGSTAMSLFDGQNWLSAQALPEKLYRKCSAINGDDWYLTGGEVVYRTSLKSLVASAVSPAAAAAAQSAVWERLPDTPHGDSGITWFRDHLLVVGGKNRSWKYTAIYAYNSLVKVWEHVSDHPGDGCHDNCCAVLPTGELLVIGGMHTYNRVLKATITVSHFPDGILSMRALQHVKDECGIFSQVARHSKAFIKATSIPCSGKTPGKKLLETWLQQTQPPPTWSTLLDILKKIGLSKVARKIREFFDPSRSTEVEGGDQPKDVEEKTSKELFQDVEQAVEDLGQKGNRQKVQAAMEKLEALKERVGEEKEDLEDKLQQAFELIHELKMEQEQLESDYEESEYSDSENPFIKQEFSEPETEADVKPVVKLEHPVKRRVKQKEVMSARKPTSKASTELRGVEAIAETVLRVTNTGRSFHWAGYGLKLSFPADCLPPGVEECLLRIQASLSGQYQLPGDTSLVSAVYWFKTKPRITFEKPFTLEIQNCAKPDNSSKLRFYRASSSQPELPYSFQPLEGGVFASHSCYGSVQLQQFCGVTVGQEGEGEKNCCTSLFYLGEGKQKQIDFVISLHLDAYLTVVLEEYAQRDALVGLNEVVQFESDAISLDIDDGGVAKNGWQLLALSAPTVEKKQVDSFKPGQIIPRCHLLLQAIEPEAKMFLHRLVMKGAKEPHNFITILSELLSPVTASQSLLTRKRQQACFRQSSGVGGKHKRSEDSQTPPSSGVASSEPSKRLKLEDSTDLHGAVSTAVGSSTGGSVAQLHQPHPSLPPALPSLPPPPPSSHQPSPLPPETLAGGYYPPLSLPPNLLTGAPLYPPPAPFPLSVDSLPSAQASAHLPSLASLPSARAFPHVSYNVQNFFNQATAGPSPQLSTPQRFAPLTYPSMASNNHSTATLDSEITDPPKLRDLVLHLRKIAADWQSLGLQMGVDPSELKRINYNGKDCEGMLTAVLEAWLRGAGSHCWREVANAVDVIDSELAQRIRNSLQD